MAADLDPTSEELRLLRQRVKDQQEELRTLRSEVSAFHESGGSAAATADEADLRARFAISRLLWENKLSEQERKEKEQQAELAKIKLSSFQRQQVNITRQLWKEQVRRKEGRRRRPCAVF